MRRGTAADVGQAFAALPSPPPPSTLAMAASLLVRIRQDSGEGDFPTAAFGVESALLHLRPETPADCFALGLVALNVVDRMAACEDSPSVEAETVAAMRAIRRALRRLANATGVNEARVLGGFYLREFREAVLEPGERAVPPADVTS